MKSLTIGQLASEANINVETVRYYERQGLITQPEKLDTYRYYSIEHLQRLVFIKQAKELGFTLKQIKELLSIRYSPEIDCNQVRAQTRVKLEEVQSKILSLQRIEKVLKDLIDACGRSSALDSCPSLNAIEKPAQNKIEKQKV